MSEETRAVAPYGTWPSPLTAADLARSSAHLADPCIDGEVVRWLRNDPARGGRYAVIECAADGATRTISPIDFNARTRVHEYGGGALGAGHGVVLACHWDDQRVYRIADGSASPVTREPGTPAGIRWASMTVLPGGQAFVAVRETHGTDRSRPNVNVHGHDEAVNELVRVDIETGDETVLVSGPDFVAGPWVDDSGQRFAWLQWNHPDMPWDTAELWTAVLTDDGPADATHVAGGESAVCDATWAGDRLVFSDDASGWWNVYAWTAGDGVVRLHNESVDSGAARWLNSTSCLAVVNEQVVAATLSEGSSHLRRIGGGSADAVNLDGVRSISDLCARDGRLVAIVGGPARPTAVVSIDPVTATLTELSAVEDDPAAAIGALPEPFSFPSPDGARAHALVYHPTSTTHRAPNGELPPLLVMSHGGPTSAASTTLNAGAQYWASRGFAVVDVNYRGSVGYGREFRNALRGNWGLHDVTDCVAAAASLVERGLADGDRLLIQGGSAGGYTTLLALCTTDTFAAGASLYGVSDLRALALDTHKFESRYLDSMIGPWPAAEELYLERSPISHVGTLTTPMIVLQGDEDAVVPPAQAALIVDALQERGLAHAYLLFEGEQHGFRKAENIARSLEARLAFFGLVLGFEPADDIALPEYVPASMTRG